MRALTQVRSVLMAWAVALAACGGDASATTDASTGDAAPPSPCGPAGACPIGTYCYSAIADGCAATGGLCLTPQPWSPACKAMLFCDCSGHTVSDCRVPRADYFSTRVASPGVCPDGGGPDASTD